MISTQTLWLIDICLASCDHLKLYAGKEAEKKEPSITISGIIIDAATVNIRVNNSQKAK